MTNEEIKRIAEAILFVNDKPIKVDDIKGVLGEADMKDIASAISELKLEYERENRSFRIFEVAGGFQIATDPSYAEWLKKFYRTTQAQRLSSPALETLAIIAYKQPATRAEMELIRGVNVDGVLNTLLERGLIRIAGRKDAAGRPIIYGTTKEFLQTFGLNTLLDLPRLKEIRDEQEIGGAAQESGQAGSGDNQAPQPAGETNS